jgi:aspartate beta-hydroxylase
MVESTQGGHSRPAAGEGGNVKMSGFYERASEVVRKIYDKRIDTPPILNAARDFPNAAKFQENWEKIRDEAIQVRLEKMPRFHDLMPEQADISANDGLDWRMFILKAYGVAVPENVARMPTLAKILAECPEVKSATISFLAPRKHIPEHRGPFRGIMRFHLGLRIPKEPSGRPATIMMIDHKEYRISDGDILLWDDTFPHEVLNNADEPRIALLLDVWRPRMPVDMEILSRVIVGVVQVGMKYRGVSYTG